MIASSHVIPDGYQQTEVGVIPVDWEVSSLGQLSEFVTSGSRGWAQYYAEHGPVFVRSQNVRDGRLDFADRQCVCPPAGSEVSRTRLNRDDLLITVTGNSVGNVAWVACDLGEAYISQHVGLVRLLEPSNAEYVCRFLAPGSPGNPQIWASQAGQSKPGLNLTDLGEFVIALPPTLAEQEAIAEALGDADALIESLEQLVAKKRHLKQAAMQQLLTGKKRLPGFDGEWTMRLLGDVAHIKTGDRNNEDKIEDGLYPFFVRSATVERINSFSHDCEAVLVPGEGGIGSIFHYVNGRFDVHQRVYAITQFAEDVSGRFAHAYMKQHFGAHAMRNSVKATVDSLRLPTFQNFEMTFPPTKDEQDAIAEVLTDMDSEIEAIEAKLAKARQIKQGMMQELLTGRTRLV